ncbi:TSUP family transporter [Isoptericola sp. 4D.3]|uniref:Probable membrane transporter protein n=1 Tax=Isoptericola peretonis TaxID=2918523 RepID=A0ABT0J264_9MICO|nr:TSUP family transporter [Isoptericola sp. 4D.3]
MDLQVDPATVVLLVAVAFAAGWLDAVVGGGGLVQVPALLLALPTAPVATVLGTNKLVAITGTSGAALTYVSRVGLDRRRALAAAGLGVPTALAGAVTASHLPRDAITLVVAATLVGVGAWAVVARPGDRPAPPRDAAPEPPSPPEPAAPPAPVPRGRHRVVVLAVGACAVGFYSGVVGARTALARGSGFVRVVLLLVVTALVVKIVHDQWLTR